MVAHLVVPLDGSTFAEHALPYAVLMARHTGAALDLALVHTTYSIATLDTTIHTTVDRWQTEQRAREASYLHEVADRLRAASGVAARPVLLAGAVAPALDRHVRDSGADLVVMTTHGRSGLQRAWLGSVADALVRHAHVPILMVRPNDGAPALGEERPLFRHMAVAVDGPATAAHCVDMALALADAETRFTLLHVVAPPRAPTSTYLPHAAYLNHELLEERRREAAAYLEPLAAGLRARGRSAAAEVLVDYHTAQAIVTWAECNGVDGIAMSAQGRGPGIRLLFRSAHREVVRGGGVPVLVG